VLKIASCAVAATTGQNRRFSNAKFLSDRVFVANDEKTDGRGTNGIHIAAGDAKIHLMFYQTDDAVEVGQAAPAKPLNLPALIERIADFSARPRYAFMVLNLIAKAPGGNSGSAGPYVDTEEEARVPLRDWLCDSLVPMAKRDARRLTIVEEVKASLAAQGALPEDAEEAARTIDQEVRERVRRSGRCNVSRAVSDLVRAGLVRRHYQGYRVDHHNRGAQREAVYTITEAAARALWSQKAR
jgi:hypothetical protein